MSLASISSWADDWRANGHNESRRWHFVDLDVGSNNPYDPQVDCKEEAQGDCIVAALERFTAVLADPRISALDKRPALMFVTHLVGDLHQPLHCSEREHDEGANLFFVIFDGIKEDRKDAITFHSLWDSVLILERIYSWGTMVADIESTVMPGLNAKLISARTYGEWANDCHAGVIAYNTLNETHYQPHDKDHPLPLGTPYADATVMKSQLAKEESGLPTCLTRRLRQGRSEASAAREGPDRDLDDRPLVREVAGLVFVAEQRIGSGRAGNGDVHLRSFQPNSSPY